jgi:hypothetical protein
VIKIVLTLSTVVLPIGGILLGLLAHVAPTGLIPVFGWSSALAFLGAAALLVVAALFLILGLIGTTIRACAKTKRRVPQGDVVPAPRAGRPKAAP